MSQESLPTKKRGEHAEADHAQGPAVGPAVGPAQNTEVITKLLPQGICLRENLSRKPSIFP